MTRPPDADARITEARRLLGDLGFDAERSNERSASVLLALLALAPSEPWSGAVALPQGTLAIMRFIETEYGHKYAANTRETIRRSTLHQFADELLVVQNPDKPDRAVNSPKWCYQIEAAAVALAHTMGTDEYSMHLTNYLAQRPGQKARQAASRKLQHLRVRFAQDEYELSPGGQNELIVKMLDEFCPRFTPDAEVLYLGDADDKWLINKTGRFEALGVEIDHHGKMPDVVVWMPDREWLILLEAC